MKPILLLLPEVPGGTPCERRQIDLCRTAPGVVVNDVEYASVIVLNDGNTDAIRRLTLALAMRRRRPTLDVGVLTYLDRDALDEPAATLVCGTTPLRIELRGQRVLLEYQEPVAAHLSELTAGSRGMRR